MKTTKFIPIVCDDPTENYIIITNDKNKDRIIIRYKKKDKIKESIILNSPTGYLLANKLYDLYKKYDIKPLMNWAEFRRNYGLEDLSKCTQNVQINDYYKNEVTYELEEIKETIERNVFDKYTGDTIFQIHPNTDDKEYVEEIIKKFNIIDNDKYDDIISQIKQKEKFKN